LRFYINKGFLRARQSFVGVDMTSETVKILLVIFMFGGLEAVMRLQPVVLKRRSRERRVRR
jgi:hypothetical protein